MLLGCVWLPIFFLKNVFFHLNFHFCAVWLIFFFRGKYFPTFNHLTRFSLKTRKIFYLGRVWFYFPWNSNIPIILFYQVFHLLAYLLSLSPLPYIQNPISSHNRPNPKRWKKKSERRKKKPNRYTTEPRRRKKNQVPDRITVSIPSLSSVKGRHRTFDCVNYSLFHSTLKNYGTMFNVNVFYVFILDF